MEELSGRESGSKGGRKVGSIGERIWRSDEE